MKQHIHFPPSPYLTTICELGLKNQLLMIRSMDCGQFSQTYDLRKIDHHLTRILCFAKQAIFPSQSEQRAAGITQYIWRTRGDGKVRASHAGNNGRIFSWNTPPEVGHPGEDYNCRCYAEPYVRGQSEFANQVVSSISETQSQWTLKDFILHFYFGRGRIVNLSQAGHLGGVANHYLYHIIRDGKNTHERVNAQIIQAARRAGSGSLNLSFDGSYSFADYRDYFGGGTVKGNFNGSTRKADGMIYIDGVISYRYSDTFTDPRSIRQRRDGTSEPLDSSLLRVLVTDFGGTFYDIVGTWDAKFSAAVKQDSKDSQYP